jgi:hypothetical protein
VRVAGAGDRPADAGDLRSVTQAGTGVPSRRKSVDDDRTWLVDSRGTLDGRPGPTAHVLIVPPPEILPPGSGVDPRVERLRQWSVLLDRAFRIPGTPIRFGWDPIVGLIPGLGDVASPLFTAAVLLQARRMRIPRIVQARMIINAMVDAALGFVPILGNIVDVGWKANIANMRLLERHAVPGLPPRRGDKAFVYGALALLGLVTLLPLALVIWLLFQVPLV